MNRLCYSAARIAPLALLLSAWPALASTTQVGQAVVEVKDESGNPVAEATVELSGTYLIGGARSGTTDENGNARFRRLTPAPEYQVVVNHPDFRPVKVTDITVKVGSTILVPVTVLAPIADRDVEEIVVTGDVPTVDTERVKLGLDISADLVEQLPSGRSYQGMVVFVPGVQDSGSAPGNPNVLGATMESNQYLLDGVSITDPLTSTFGANFNFDAIQSVEVITGGRDAEYGNAQGGVINIVTKGGSNEFEFDGSVYWQPNEFQLRRIGETERYMQDVDINLAAGGPIIEDELWYYVSLTAPMTWSTRPEAEGGSIFPDQRGEARPTRNFMGLFPLGKLTWQATESTTLKLLFQYDPAVIHNGEQSSLYHPDAEYLQKQGGLTAALYAETYFTDDLFLDTRVSLKHDYLSREPECAEGHPDAASNCRDLAGRINAGNDSNTVNYNRLTNSLRSRAQISSALTYNLDDWLGEHQFKAGFEISYTSTTTEFDRPGGEYYIDKGLTGDPMSASGAGMPYQLVKVIEAENTTVWGDVEGAFIQDVWKPLDNLTIRPGVRFDSARLRNYADETQLEVNIFSPRIGVAWDPWDNGKTQIRAGYYMYTDTGYLSISKFAGGRSILERTYEYNGVTGEYDIFVRQTGGEEAGGGTAVAKDYLKDSWNQRRPRTHEVIAGFARELAEDLNFSIDYTYKFAENQWEDDEVNVIWNDDGTNAIGYRNGDPTWLFSMGAMRDSWLRYHSVQVQLNKRFSRNWQMLTSYTWSHAVGTQAGDEISEAFDIGRLVDLEYGYSPWDVRHDIKVAGSYQLPMGFIVGGRFQFRTGAPYSHLYSNSLYNSYTNLQYPRGTDSDCLDGSNTCDLEGRTQLRLPDMVIINARVQWQLEELTGQKVDVILDAFNLLNLEAVTEVEENDGASFGEATDTQSAASFQIGLRYRY